MNKLCRFKPGWYLYHCIILALVLPQTSKQPEILILFSLFWLKKFDWNMSYFFFNKTIKEKYFWSKFNFIINYRWYTNYRVPIFLWHFCSKIFIFYRNGFFSQWFHRSILLISKNKENLRSIVKWLKDIFKLFHWIAIRWSLYFRNHLVDFLFSFGRPLGQRLYLYGIDKPLTNSYL